MNFDEKPYLREVQFRRDSVDNHDVYPFNIPAVQGLDFLDFHPDVTFLLERMALENRPYWRPSRLRWGLMPKAERNNQPSRRNILIHRFTAILKLLRASNIPQTGTSCELKVSTTLQHLWMKRATWGCMAGNRFTSNHMGSRSWRPW